MNEDDVKYCNRGEKKLAGGGGRLPPLGVERGKRKKRKFTKQQKKQSNKPWGEKGRRSTRGTDKRRHGGRLVVAGSMDVGETEGEERESGTENNRKE